ncbi:Rhomboid-like protein 15 [Zea mays]|uniref:Rhomboid-like protein 15 n=1 Tax=Zea mays TaxID=4577 RepID=A0A1D6KZD0_MAIZE|nr:Rhomboid-like protein 15 [Zea mays]
MGYDAIFSWTQAGIPTRLNQWWSSIPFVTSGVILICGVIYLLCLLIGYDSYVEICFLPSAVASHFQVSSASSMFLQNGTLFFLHVLMVRMDFASAISVSRKQCFIAGTPLWHLVRICMFVLYILLIYTYGLFNYLLPGPSFYSKIEGLSALSVCVRRPGFIMCTGGTTYGQLPTYSNTSAAPSALINGNFLRNISSWMPSRHTSTAQEGEDPRFPGRARTLGSVGTEPTAREASAHLHARLLDNTTPSDPLTNTQHTAVNTVRADATVTAEQVDTFDEELKKLVGMGFEKTQAEVALAAADGDPNVAIEILMSQQG